MDLGDSGWDEEYGWGRVNAYKSLLALERVYYPCDADITHTDDSGEYGFGVPDGKVDADDYAVFMWAYNNDNLIADVTTTGFTTPSGGGANGEPDEIIDGDDLIYFLDFYSDCDNQDCPACPLPAHLVGRMLDAHRIARVHARVSVLDGASLGTVRNCDLLT